MFIVQEGKLLHNDAPFIISSFQNTVEVVGKYPASSVVYCHIHGYTEDIKFPLVCSKLTDMGYLFKGQIVINRKLADYMNNNPDKDFYFKFTFNNEPIEGQQKILINYESVLSYLSTITEPIVQLLSKVNQLSVRIDSYILGTNTKKMLNAKTAQIGMSPIAIDNFGNYIWDYPFAKEKETLKSISIILQGISEQLSSLNSRVEAVEQKLLNHVYETYEL